MLSLPWCDHQWSDGWTWTGDPRAQQEACEQAQLWRGAATSGSKATAANDPHSDDNLTSQRSSPEIQVARGKVTLWTHSRRAIRHGPFDARHGGHSGCSTRRGYHRVGWLFRCCEELHRTSHALTRAIFLARGSSSHCGVLCVRCLQNIHHFARMSCSARCLISH